MYELALLGVVAYVIWAWFKHAARQAADRAERALSEEALVIARAAAFEHGEGSSFDRKTWTVNFFTMTMEMSYSFAGDGAGIGQWTHTYRIRQSGGSAWEEQFTPETRSAIVRQIEHDIVESNDSSEVEELRRQLDGVKTMEWRSIDSRVASVLTFRFPRFELASRGARPEVMARAKQIATEPLFHGS